MKGQQFSNIRMTLSGLRRFVCNPVYSSVKCLTFFSAKPEYITEHFKAAAIIKVAKNRHQVIVRELINLKADISVRNRSKHTALFYVSQNDDMDIVLLKNRLRRASLGGIRQNSYTFYRTC